jgi:hypothetical protein
MNEFHKFLDRLNNSLTFKDIPHGLFDQIPDPGPVLGQADLLAFLWSLEAWLPREVTKAKVAKDATEAAERLKAIKKIEEFVMDKRKQSMFPKIDKNIFAFQLAVRVRNPRKIDQKNVTLCGPAALVYDVAKRNPVAYVDFAISLFSTGAGSFGATVVQPSEKIRQGYRSDLLPEADYVVLASVRDADAIVMSSDLLRGILTLTKPGALCEFLLRAGYRDVEDHTFLNLSLSLKVLNAVTAFRLNASNRDAVDRGEGNLRRAAYELNTLRRFVVMLADIDVARAATRADPKKLVPAKTLDAGNTHWTAVRRLQITGNKVEVKLITSTGSYRYEFDKDVLLSRYAGYVSAQP